jgi:hypothetical protein
MDLREIGLGGCGLDSTGSGQVPVAGCCECGDEPSGSCATELVSLLRKVNFLLFYKFLLHIYVLESGENKTTINSFVDTVFHVLET